MKTIDKYAAPFAGMIHFIPLFIFVLGIFLLTGSCKKETGDASSQVPGALCYVNGIGDDQVKASVAYNTDGTINKISFGPGYAISYTYSPGKMTITIPQDTSSTVYDLTIGENDYPSSAVSTNPYGSRSYFSFEYNAENYLIKAERMDSMDGKQYRIFQTYVYQNGNVTRIYQFMDFASDTTVFEYAYFDKANSLAVFDEKCLILSMNDPLGLHPGKGDQQLMKSVSEYGQISESYIYEFDSRQNVIRKKTLSGTYMWSYGWQCN